MGEGAACCANLLPCPIGEQTRGSCSHMNGGRPKGWGEGGFRTSCPVQVMGAWAKGRGAYLLRAALCPPFACRGRWREPCAWKEGKQGGGHQQGTSGGARTGGATSGGFVCTPTPLARLCACVFQGRSLPAGGSERREGWGVGPSHMSHEYTEMCCCLHVVLLCFTYFNFVFSLKYKWIKLFKKRSLNLGACKAGRTV
jgi:hypothetical protein